MKVIIVGGVAGGATVAARLRRLDEKAEIIIFEKGEYVSYANCGLPYYIGNTIEDREKLFVQTEEGFNSRFNIDIRTQSEVVRINPDEKTVVIHNGKNNQTYVEAYDKLVLSPGAEPIRPSIPGLNNPKIFTLRNIPDTDKIKNHIQQENPQKAIVVGGGFIGLEMAENLNHAGLQVEVIEMGKQVMAPIDFSMAAIVHQHLKSKNIGLHFEKSVIGFESNNAGIKVQLNNGEVMEADLVIWSIGVRPEIGLVKSAGLAIGESGGLIVDEYMQTSVADIYALGDAVETINLVTGKPALIPLAGPANKQGRIVADNIVMGNKRTYAGTIGTSIVKVFDLTVAVAGVSAKVLQRENISYVSSFTHGFSHAGYYPGAKPLSVKIIFSPHDARLYGAQVVGFEGVDKRIEMMAQVIQNKGTIHDLTELEHAYAPPYSSAKDPVNMAGYVAENILYGKVKIIHWCEMATLSKDDYIIIDARTAYEHSLGNIAGSINIPVDELRNRIHEIPANKKIILYCAIGLRGYLSSCILLQNGFTNVYNLSGGYKTYSVATGSL